MNLENHKILIVDDDDLFRKSVMNTLRSSKEISFDVFGAKVGEEAIEIMSENQDIACIILDYNFEKWGGTGQMNGLEIAEKIKEDFAHIPIIMTSEVGDRGDIAMKAAKSYILDFLDKPFTKEQLFQKLGTIFHPAEEKAKKAIYTNAIETLNGFGFITMSPVVGKVCYNAILAARSDWNVLIIGETGTGKTLLAKIIHQLSDRKNENYTEINCGSFTQSLIESELFGHRKGSFTDAKNDKKGIFEIAGKGTLLLDEIGEIPEHIQAKLLYTLGEQKTFSPVGKPNEILKNRARVIAATIYELKNDSENKKIRDDLIGRFNQIIKIPPLRERPEDIPLLVEHVVTNYCEENNIENIRIEDDALKLLCRQPWIKNVRQLKAVIQRALGRAIFEKKNIIGILDFEEELMNEYGFTSINVDSSIHSLTSNLAKKLIQNRVNILKDTRNAGGLKAMTDLLEKEIIQEVLKLTDNNVLAAAKLLNENKDTFRNHLEKYLLISSD